MSKKKFYDNSQLPDYCDSKCRAAHKKTKGKKGLRMRRGQTNYTCDLRPGDELEPGKLCPIKYSQQTKPSDDEIRKMASGLLNPASASKILSVAKYGGR